MKRGLNVPTTLPSAPPSRISNTASSRPPSATTTRRWDTGAWASGFRPSWAWGLAAAAVILVAVVGVAYQGGLFGFRTGGWLRIEIVDGALLEVSGNSANQLASGSTLANGEWIRMA